MSSWLRTRAWALLGYVAIVALVIGGLGWVTAAALRLELSDTMRLALWRLDSRVAPALAREDSRPYQHYDPLFVPLPVMNIAGQALAPGSVLEPSPLLNAEMPSWIALHFQTSADGKWQSPQVLNDNLAAKFQQAQIRLDLSNVTPERAELLAALQQYPVAVMLGHLPNLGDEPSIVNEAQQRLEQQQAAVQQVNPGVQNPLLPNDNSDLANRLRQQNAFKGEARGGNTANTANYNLTPLFGDVIPWGELGGKWAGPSNGRASTVQIGLFMPLWLRAEGQPERLVLARLAQSGGRKVVQGVLLDWQKLQEILTAEVQDLFPNARMLPLPDGPPEYPERVMTALPIQLDPGPLTASVLPGWSPLRVGLLLAWAAALLALLVVGLGGWSLFDLSERRFRFVSAVTHELRTPLTTLRLYLDMLTSGLVREELKKEEYLHTLHGESDRLHRLVSNVLDFARLEKQRPKLAMRPVAVPELLDGVRQNWQSRCAASGKELIVEVTPGCGVEVTTDPQLVEQILGNLIDNACKYSRGATDNRVWLRARRDGRSVLLEVEDRGPGVPPRERRLIFRAFRRGRQADVTAGGVGLGLALAVRWARLLGGRLHVQPGAGDVGACFQLRLHADA
ncbi:MAG TPA: HAMP domain-containing sensor histidine kinase [Gemmataceae bacterium]|jgi:signal transduction histidine kinase|nr:HAMP domain-containing sensor histidine kinase [Gemmataceae bacterium]